MLRKFSVGILSLVFLICLFSSVCFAEINSDVINLLVRDNVTENYLITWDDSGSPTTAVILFAGSDGQVGIEKSDNTIKLEHPGNFLVRSREYFVNSHTVSVVVDPPSDNRNGMSDSFRASNTHADDLSKIVADVKTRFPGIKVYFVGTSRGTVSAAYAGRALQSELEGIVLTSTYMLKGGLADFRFQDIKIPLLMIHNSNDECPVCPYSEAKRVSDKFKIPFITVHGGDSPISKPCVSRSYHGFLGKEKEVTNAILNWISRAPIAKDI